MLDKIVVWLDGPYGNILLIGVAALSLATWLWALMNYKEEVMKAKLGSGARFKAVEASAAKSGARDPAAVAAAVGRKKYGATKMMHLALEGRKRKK